MATATRSRTVYPALTREQATALGKRGLLKIPNLGVESLARMESEFGPIPELSAGYAKLDELGVAWVVDGCPAPQNK